MYLLVVIIFDLSFTRQQEQELNIVARFDDRHTSMIMLKTELEPACALVDFFTRITNYFGDVYDSSGIDCYHVLKTKAEMVDHVLKRANYLTKKKLRIKDESISEKIGDKKILAGIFTGKKEQKVYYDTPADELLALI